MRWVRLINIVRMLKILLRIIVALCSVLCPVYIYAVLGALIGEKLHLVIDCQEKSVIVQMHVNADELRESFRDH